MTVEQAGFGDMSLAALALASVRQFASMAAAGALHLRRDRLGQSFAAEDGGSYRIFRESVSESAGSGTPAVLVVGFRLRVIHSFRLPHWIFQRLCILTTPFWSGFPGFRVKLWMVDPATKSYQGIYDWRGDSNAQTYVDALSRVLRPLSTSGSVWHELYPGKSLEGHLQENAIESSGQIAASTVILTEEGSLRRLR